jgi:dephospho-CoA kinase
MGAMKVVALVGMAGSGKSEVARIFQKKGFIPVRFGDITDEEVGKRGLELNEASERLVREEFRRQHGMAAYAKLNLPRIEAARREAAVVVDGMYSWEEYVFLKEHYNENFAVVAVWASPAKRYERLSGRQRRGLTAKDAASRDHAEIENLNKGGPIAMADYVITNEGSLEELKEQAERAISGLR